MLVNSVSVTITDVKGETIYDSAFVTSLPVTRDIAGEIVACARTRLKIENEGFNVLKSNGCHLEHNSGHGKQNLAMIFADINLLAFAIHAVCDCLEQAWIDVRIAQQARKCFFEHIRITVYLVSPNWQTLIHALIDSKPPPGDRDLVCDGNHDGGGVQDCWPEQRSVGRRSSSCRSGRYGWAGKPLRESNGAKIPVSLLIALGLDKAHPWLPSAILASYELEVT